MDDVPVRRTRSARRGRGHVFPSSAAEATTTIPRSKPVAVGRSGLKETRARERSEDTAVAVRRRGNAQHENRGRANDGHGPRAAARA